MASLWNFIIVLLLIDILCLKYGFCIDCYVCTSVNRSDQYCEDTFNTDYPGVNYLQTTCNGYRKDRSGYFPADHCIKVSGTSTKDSNYTIMIRTCALDSGTLTADTEIVRMSHCGHFVFDRVYFSGCVQACQRDGCNGSRSIYRRDFLLYNLLMACLGALTMFSIKSFHWHASKFIHCNIRLSKLKLSEDVVLYTSVGSVVVTHIWNGHLTW